MHVRFATPCIVSANLLSGDMTIRPINIRRHDDSGKWCSPYKIVNNPIEKMYLSEIQLEKFMRHNMNMNKNIFHTFLECFH